MTLFSSTDITKKRDFMITTFKKKKKKMNMQEFEGKFNFRQSKPNKNPGSCKVVGEI